MAFGFCCKAYWCIVGNQEIYSHIIYSIFPTKNQEGCHFGLGFRDEGSGFATSVLGVLIRIMVLGLPVQKLKVC